MKGSSSIRPYAGQHEYQLEIHTSPAVRAAFMASVNALAVVEKIGDTYKIVEYNRTFKELIGTPEIEHTENLFAVLRTANLLEPIKCLLDKVTAVDGPHARYQIRWSGKNGKARFLSCHCHTVKDETGPSGQCIIEIQEVTDYVEAQRKSELYSRAIEAAPLSISIADHQGRVLVANRIALEWHGCSPREATSVRCAKPLTESDTGMTFLQMPDRYDDPISESRFTVIGGIKENPPRYIEQHIVPLDGDNGPPGYVASFGRDVSEFVRRETLLRDRANRDALTGLLNRHAGQDYLNTLYRRALIRDTPFSIVICDIDRFKSINDEHGHLQGDDVLQRVSRTLLKHVRSADQVVRWGGEEFLILLPDADVGDAFLLADRVRQAVQCSVSVSGRELTISSGVAAYDTGDDTARLLARADKALYDAKSDGRNTVRIGRSPANVKKRLFLNRAPS